MPELETFTFTLSKDEYVLIIAALTLYAQRAFSKGAEKQFSMAVVLIAYLGVEYAGNYRHHQQME